MYSSMINKSTRSSITKFRDDRDITSKTKANQALRDNERIREMGDDSKLKLAHLAKFISIATRESHSNNNSGVFISVNKVRKYLYQQLNFADDNETTKIARNLINIANIESPTIAGIKEWFLSPNDKTHTMSQHVKDFITDSTIKRGLGLNLRSLTLKSHHIDSALRGKTGNKEANELCDFFKEKRLALAASPMQNNQGDDLLLQQNLLQKTSKDAPNEFTSLQEAEFTQLQEAFSNAPQEIIKEILEFSKTYSLQFNKNDDIKELLTGMSNEDRERISKIDFSNAPQVTDQDLSLLSTKLFPNLETISLSNCKRISFEGLQSIYRFKLKELDISNMEINANSLVSLSKGAIYSSLERLIITGCRQIFPQAGTFSMIGVLKKCHKLTHLDISRSTILINEKLGRAILNHASLKTIIIRGCSITDKLIKLIETYKDQEFKGEQKDSGTLTKFGQLDLAGCKVVVTKSSETDLKYWI